MLHVRAPTHRFNFQTAREANAPPPVLIWSAPGRPHSNFIRPSSKKHRGRAGRQGSRSDPRASTPRDIEVVEVRMPAFALSSFGAASRKSASPKASRARCLEACSAKVPGSRTFKRPKTTVYRVRTRPRAVPSDGGWSRGRQGPRRNAVCAGSFAAWTAGQCQRISAATSFPGHRSPPRI